MDLATFSLGRDSIRQLKALAQRYQLSKTEVLRILIRRGFQGEIRIKGE